MVDLDTPWSVAPLDGKYYGTEILNNNGDCVMKVWNHSDATRPSEREDDDGSYDSHWESAEDLARANEIVRRINAATSSTS